MGEYAAAPPGSRGSQPALAAYFRALFDACPGCGWVTPEEPCPGCGGTPTVAGAPAAVGAFLGKLVRVPGRWSGKYGVVVSLHPGEMTIVRRDGSVATVPEGRCHPVQTPPGRGLVRSPAGAVLAAAGLSLPPAASRELHRQALALAGASPPDGWRALAADCAALGRVDVPAGLPLPETEQTWWTACAMWTAGQHDAAAAELLKLPAGRYPARLVLWWRAATGGSLPMPLRPAVGLAAREFGQAAPAAAVAAAFLLRTLGERTGVAGDEQVVAAVHRLGGDEVAARLDGQAGDSTAARLLGVLSGRMDPEQLCADPALPAAAPLPVLDDLVDRGQFPHAWLAMPSGAGQEGYLRARAAIETMDDAQLVALGAHDERARRSVRRGDPLPADLPAEVAARFGPLPAALGSDEEALVTVAGASGLDVDRLRTALADPAGLPAGQLLADGSVARLLLDRSTADPTGWLALQTDPHQRGFAARLALRRAKSFLYSWDWAAALDAARTCLRFTSVEMLRDEAQNVIAAAQWQLGNDQAASAALDAALDGEYTAALQVNYAVVASELEPQQAAAHLSRLVLEAPDLPLRVSAARQAVRLWRSGHQWEHGEPLPADLAGPLRSLVTEPVEYDAFRDLVGLLAVHDHKWLATPGALAGSPHRQTQAARLWAAKARGVQDFVAELAAVLKAAPESWVEELRDMLLTDLLDQLQAPGESQLWAYGVLMLDHRLPMPFPAWAELLARTVSAACAGIDLRTAEPAGKFLDWLQQAVTEVARQPERQRDELLGWLRPPLAVLAGAYVTARRYQYEQAQQQYESIRTQLASIVPGRTVDMDALRSAVQPGVDRCQATVALLKRLAQVMGQSGLEHYPSGLVSALDGLRGQCEQLQRQLTQVRMSPAGIFGAATRFPG